MATVSWMVETREVPRHGQGRTGVLPIDRQAGWQAEGQEEDSRDAPQFGAGSARTLGQDGEEKGDQGIAAIYARKSTQDTRSKEEGKSTARRIENATAYAVAKGWT